MGCGGSKEEEVEEEAHVEVTDVEAGEDELTTNKVSLEIAETDAVKAKPGSETFIASVLKAREEASEDAEIMKDCCTRLQAYNRRLKEYVATYDANTVNEAMNGGFMGMGCNDNKLIAALCTRTKSQLQRTKKKYRDLYDKDMRSEVQGETGGAYRKLMYFVLAAPDAYIADIIDMACNEAAILEFGCDEICLLEVFVTHTQEELQAGKSKWEGRTDKSLVDFINSNLGHSYRHLNRLLQLLFMGDRVETDETDEELAATQVGELKEECDKGWFEDFDESKIIEIIGANTTAQNQLVAQLYEKEHGVSLGRELKGKCGERLFYALSALLLTKADFLAMRLNDAMKGWFNDKKLLTRLLGGLDGDKMQGVADAFERKYDQPLWSALKENIDGDFLRAALTWINALEEPSRGAEKFTEQEVDALGDDAEQLTQMLDWLLLEHDSLLVFVAHLDIETIREACKGWGTDDTALIRAFATRNKRSLARVNVGYRQKHGEPLQQLIDSELGGSSKNEWYLYLAKFLVVQEEQADSMILDLALQGGNVDHEALVEFLCGRHPKRVRAAKERWEMSHDDSLVDILQDHLSGDMARLAMKMLKGKRDTDDPVDEKLARQQAHQLHDGELDYVDTLTMNSAAQNKAVSRYFEDAYDTSLKRAIGQEYSGPVKAALLALMLGPADWYAAQLKAALGGETTNDKAVCRIIGAHDKDEIKAIASAYDKKYGVSLKAAISSECRGNYKRLAVAWVSLPDQLAQPEKLIERHDLPEDVPEEPTNEGHGEAFDDEISDEDDSVSERPDPHGPLFAAKMANWTAKYNKYNDMGKKAKADHYQRLILWYPPMPLGHKVLKGYLEALSEEYKGGKQSDDDWTTIWFETVSDEDFDADGDGESDGTDRAAFKAWMDVTESMIAEKRTTIRELKSRWGLDEKKEEEKPKYEEPVLASYPAAVPVATYANNYPQAMPVAQPVAQPVARPVAQPMQYVRPPAYPGTPPIYGGAAPPIYGQQPMMMQQPMMYGGGMYQPQMMRPMMYGGGGVQVSVNVNVG